MQFQTAFVSNGSLTQRKFHDKVGTNNFYQCNDCKNARRGIRLSEYADAYILCLLYGLLRALILKMVQKHLNTIPGESTGPGDTPYFKTYSLS